MKRTYTIAMPLSADELGRWLEEHNVELSISCVLARYCVRLEWGRVLSYNDETGRHTETRVLTRYDHDLTVALADAIGTAKRLMAEGWKAQAAAEQ